MLDEIKVAMSYKGINLNYTNDVCRLIAEKCEGGKLGARELRNYIRRNIEDKLVSMLIDEKSVDIKELKINVKNGEISLNQ